MEIRTGADPRGCTEAFLVRHFGKAGAHLHRIAHSIDDRPVIPDRPRKSAGSETTFATDLRTEAGALAALDPLVEDVWRWREQSGALGRSVTVKVRYADFSRVTRSRTVTTPIAQRTTFAAVAADLLRGVFPRSVSARELQHAWRSARGPISRGRRP